MDDWNEYGTYETEDDFYQWNQNEADDYRHEADEYDRDFESEDWDDEEDV